MMIFVIRVLLLLLPVIPLGFYAQAQDAPPVQMDAFVIEADREDIRDFLPGGRNDWFVLDPVWTKHPTTGRRVFSTVTLRRVKRSSPAYKAGMRSGQRVHKIQEIMVSGETKEDFEAKVLARPEPNVMRLYVTTGTKSIWFKILLRHRLTGEDASSVSVSTRPPRRDKQGVEIP